MTPHPLSTPEVVELEGRLASLNATLHEMLLATNRVSVPEWNEKIAPKFKAIADSIIGSEVHARTYRTHESIYPPARFVATHRHVEGGEYKMLAAVRARFGETDVFWSGVRYVDKDGIEYATGLAHWYSRFQEIEKKPDATSVAPPAP